MGHTFCRSHWRAKINGKWEEWRNPPCFADVRAIWKETELLQTKVVPSLQDGPEKTNLTVNQVDSFLDDVLKAIPGVAKRIDAYTFEYPLGSVANYWKFLGHASLIRCVEEWWHWVDNYFEMRDSGIPRDVALLTMGLGGQEHMPQAHSGHAILGSLATLKSLKHFNFVDALIRPADRLKENDHPSLWSLIEQPPWFGIDYRYPHTFKLTPKIYSLFLRDDLSDMERQLLINKKVYNAIEVE